MATPDLPGCGAEHATTSPTSVAAIAAHVRGQVHAASDRHRDQPVWLLAMSLGAMVACQWMLAHPGEVAGVVLINGSVGALSPPWRRMRVAGLLRLVRAALSRDPVARERLIASVVSGRPAAVEGALARWVELARGRPVRLATALRQILAAARFRLPAAVTLPAAAAAAATTVPVPALVLVSASDRLVHPSCSAAIARRLEAVVREHPDAGHDLPLDDPDWVADQVDDWLVAETRSAT